MDFRRFLAATTGASILGTSASAWACPSCSTVFENPGCVIMFSALALVLLGWGGSLLSAGLLWRLRKRLSWWRYGLIVAAGALVTAMNVTFVSGFVQEVGRLLGIGKLNDTWEIVVIVSVLGVCAVLQAAYTMAAYRLLRRR